MKIESNNYGIRKNVLEYDQVMNEQREIIYAERLRVLDGDNMRDVIFKMIRDVVKNHVHMHIPAENQVEEKDLEKLEQKIAAADLDMESLAQGLIQVIPYTNVSWKPEDHAGENAEQLIRELQEKAIEIYEAKEKDFPEEEHIRELERVVPVSYTHLTLPTT